MARLRILSDDDFDKLYKTPKLNDKERELIFELDEIDKNYLNTLNNISVKINYILHLGYFKISQYFFSFSFQEVKEDVRFIIKTYFPETSFPTKQISNRQYYLTRRIILKKYEMSLYEKNFANSLNDYLKTLTKQHTAYKYLFDAVLDYCHKHKIVRPAYSVLQELIASSLNNEKVRLSKKLDKLIDSKLRNSLDDLLKKDDLLYRITLIKKDQKDFTTGEIRSTIEKHQLLVEIYISSVEIVKQLEISWQNVALYAQLAEQYTVYGLRSLQQRNLARLYLLCYIYNRFLKINDHLVSSFIYKVSNYISAADDYQKEAVYLAQVVDKENRALAADILSLHNNKKIADNELRSRSFSIVAKSKFPEFIKNIRQPHLTPDFYRWQYYNNNISAIKLNTRMTFKALDFQAQSKDLSEAISFLKAHFDNNKSFSDYKFTEIPVEFIPFKLRKYVITKVKSTGNRKKILTINANYEFMLYIQIEKGLRNGAITIKDSFSYRSLDDELIRQEDWQENKGNILKSLESQLISIDIKQILDQLESLLSNRYHEINQKISSGINSKIKIKYNKKGKVVNWRMPYKKMDDGVNNPFYENMDIASLGQIIKFTNHHTDFMKKFTHILPSYSKTRATESSIAACLVAKGTGTDIYKMKDISDVKEQDLKFTYNNFIRYETLTDASDVVMNQVAKLPIFEQYTLADYGIHASVDGQKLETRYNTIKARYSSKYYGFGKGVSAYTLFANCLPLCTKIIGSNEHESHYLLDALKSNSSDIVISAVSGDMHSINRINFILLYIFGYRFMPRFTKLDQKAGSNMVSFDEPCSSRYKGFIIHPSNKVNKNLVIKESDNYIKNFCNIGTKAKHSEQYCQEIIII